MPTPRKPRTPPQPKSDAQPDNDRVAEYVAQATLAEQTAADTARAVPDPSKPTARAYGDYRPEAFRDNIGAKAINAGLDAVVGKHTGVPAQGHQVGEAFTALAYYLV